MTAFVDGGGRTTHATPQTTATPIVAAPEPVIEGTADGPGQVLQPGLPSEVQLFVAHGTNKKPLDQLKKILDEFGLKYVSAIEEPNASRPISTKVAELMRSSTGDIFIFTADDELTNLDGEAVLRPCENVIFELEAASLLDEHRIVIFKEDGVTLPTDFSDLGYIPFEVDRLDAKMMDLFKELRGLGMVKILSGENLYTHLTPASHTLRGAAMIRLALWVLIASVVVGAVLGIWALLVGDVGETQLRMLGTTFSITGAGALAIVFGRSVGRADFGRLPYAGLALTLASLLAINGGLWGRVDEDWFWKLTFSLVVVTVTVAHASLVSPAGLAVAFRWVAWSAIGSGVLLASLILLAVWGSVNGSLIGRGIGIFAILAAAASVAVPVMRRLSRVPEPVDTAALVNFCPRCGEGLMEAPGDIECPHCGARSRIEFTVRGTRPGQP